MDAKRFSLCLLTLLSCARPIGSGFLAIPNSAESLALGSHPLTSAYTTLNPAGLLLTNSGPTVRLSYGSWLADSRQLTAAWMSRIHQGDFAIFMRYVGLAGLELRTETPSDDPLATFNAYGTSLEAQYSRGFGKQKVGLGVKVVRLELYTAGSTGLALDLGYIIKPARGIEIGAAILNLGSFYKQESQETDFPLRVLAGIALRSDRMFMEPRIIANVEWTSQIDAVIARGALEGHWNQLLIRAGIEHSPEVLSWSSGFGLAFGTFDICYSFRIGSQDLGIPNLVDIVFHLP